MISIYFFMAKVVSLQFMNMMIYFTLIGAAFQDATKSGIVHIEGS